MTKVRLVAASSDTLLVTGNGSLLEDWLRQTRTIKFLVFLVNTNYILNELFCCWRGIFRPRLRTECGYSGQSSVFSILPSLPLYLSLSLLSLDWLWLLACYCLQLTLTTLIMCGRFLIPIPSPPFCPPSTVSFSFSFSFSSSCGAVFI